MKLVNKYIAVFLLFFAVSSFAQVQMKQNKGVSGEEKKYKRWSRVHHFKSKYRYWSVGGSLGMSNYKGDLNPKNSLITHSFSDTRFSVGADITWRYSSRVSFRGSLTYIRIASYDQENADPDGDPYSDLARYTRNLSFFNNVFELKTDVIVDLFENRRSMRSRQQWTPYAFTGIALFYHSPQADYGGESYHLRDLGTQGQLLDGGEGAYPSFGIAIPMGIGIRYKLNASFDIAFEMGARLTFTDYLDDVGEGNYANKWELGTPNDIAVLLSDRSVERELHPNAQQILGQDKPKKETHIYNGQSYEYEFYGAYGKDVEPKGGAGDDWYMVAGFHLTYIFHPKVYASRYRG